MDSETAMKQTRLRMFNEYARNVEFAADQVGANDTELANRLYACATDLRAIAKEGYARRG